MIRRREYPQRLIFLLYPLVFALSWIAIPSATLAVPGGTVTGVEGDQVTITLETGGSARPGDDARLVYVTSSGREINVGIWTVTTVEGNRVSAVPKAKRTTPREGLKVIFAPSSGGVATAASTPMPSGEPDLPSGESSLPDAPGGLFGGETEGVLDGGLFGPEPAAGSIMSFDEFMHYQTKLEEGERLLEAGDFAGAQPVLREAAKGSGEAAFHLSRIYREGLGVAVDLRESLHWLQRAAEQEHPEAQFSVAAFYEEGRGIVPQDMGKALLWYRRAAALGHEGAKRRLKELGE